MSDHVETTCGDHMDVDTTWRQHGDSMSDHGDVETT